MSGNPDVDPLHFSVVAEHVRWSRVNISEALPGVCTALGFTFWQQPNEIGVRRGLYRVGACDSAEIKMPARPEDHNLGAFHGRVAINLSLQGLYFDRVPGYSASMQDAVMLAREDDSAPNSQHPRESRPLKLVSATRIAWCAFRLPGQQSRLRREVTRWWSHAVGIGKPAGIDEAVAAIVQGHDRFEHIMCIHMATGMIMGAVYAQLARLTATAGHPGLETRLVSGVDGVDETQSLRLLWDVAHGRSNLEDFIAEHGFHGPAEGQISEPSWRENPGLLAGVVEEMSLRGEDESPQALERRRAETCKESQQTLLSNLSRRQRLKAGFLLYLVNRFVPMRENSKACFLRVIDAARCAARVLGSHMANAGVLASPDDIFHLAYTEIKGRVLWDSPDKLRELIARRTARRNEFLHIDLPFEWCGVPEPVAIASDRSDAPTSFDGVGVSPGIVDGRANVVTDPTGEIRIQAGEILVCPMTDPSWAGLLMLASGAVIDMGGPLSHGAVVARELGIPCVMNTVHGTKTLRTGDYIRMDGEQGTIEVLETAEQAEARHD